MKGREGKGSIERQVCLDLAPVPDELLCLCLVHQKAAVIELPQYYPVEGRYSLRRTQWQASLPVLDLIPKLS